MDELTKKRATGRARSKPPALASAEPAEPGEAEEAVQALLAELRGQAGWDAADAVLGASALSLARALDSGPLMSRGAVARELRSTVEKLPKPTRADSPVDRILAARAARQAEAAHSGNGDGMSEN